MINATTSNPVHVIGHRNPDMDAIAAAIGYAWLLSSREPGKYEAARAGQVNAQTAYALQRFDVPEPPLVNDVRSRVGELARHIEPLDADLPLRLAAERLEAIHAPIPLAENGKPLGLLTPDSLFRQLAPALRHPDALVTALDQPARAALDSLNLVLDASAYTRDVLPQVLRSEQDDFIVLDTDGAYRGLCAKAALLAPPPRRLILVDHNEPGQAVPGADEADIVEIIDHHRLSSLPTDTPIPIDIQPVGSTSTLVAERTRADGVALPPGVAGVLLCGILSDTLVFRSPTTTARDRAVARWLGEAAGLYTENISPDEAIAALGEALLGAGAELGGRSADDIVRADLKLYEVGRLRVGVAQTEVTGFAALDARHTDLGIALERLRETDHLALALLVVTDVLRGDSRILAAGEPRLIAALPYRHRDDNTLDAPGVVSRKKQILPALLAALAAFA